MNAEAEAMSAELAEELASNERRYVDPKSVPARFSTLKAMAESPLHYMHACQDAREETLSMRLGLGADALLFDQPLAVWDQPAKTGKGKAPRNGGEWEKFKAANANKVIVNRTELTKAEQIVAAIKRSEPAMRVLFPPKTEMTYQRRIDWDWDGRSFRSTPDAFGPFHLVDLKCLKSAEPDKVMWQSRSMAFNAQAALYVRALKEKLNITIRDCYLVVAENKPPFPVTVLRFTERALEIGDKMCCAWNERRRLHEDSGTYPGYVQTVVDLDVPGEDDIDSLGLTFADEDGDA